MFVTFSNLIKAGRSVFDITNLQNNSFIKSNTKNALFLFTASFLNLLITVGITPLISRIYSSSDFAVLSLYTAFINIISQFVTFKYDYKIASSNNLKEAKNLLIISCFVAFIVSSALFLIIPFKTVFLQVLKISELNFLYFVPIGAFFVGVNAPLCNTAIYLEKYKLAGASIVIKGAITAFFQIILYDKFPLSLVLSQCAGYIFSDIVLFLFAFKSLTKANTQLDGIISTAKQNIGYPKYIVIGSLCACCSFNLQNFIIISLFGEVMGGNYAVVIRILSVPITVVGTAIGQILLKNIGEGRSFSSSMDIIKKTSYFLWVSSILGFSGIFILRKFIIRVFLGSKYEFALLFLVYLLPYFLIRFAVSPVILALPIFKKQKQITLWQGLLLVATFIIYGTSIILKLDIKAYLVIYSFLMCILYLAIYFYTINIKQAQ